MNVSLMPVISKVAPKTGRFISRKKLVLNKQAPHIFFGAGIVGMVGSTVLACRATLKLPETLDEIQEDVNAIKEFKRDREDGVGRYREEELARDTAYIYGKAAYKLGRLYGPSVAVGLVSIGALSGAHVNLSRRNTALMAAYATVSKAYADYRERVRDQLGVDSELDIYHARVDAKETEDGDEVPVVDPDKYSPYARFFDEASIHFDKNSEINRFFIQCQQNYANDKLRAQGHLFLNEVYDMLGFERTTAGSVVGWVLGRKQTGDGYVDFGVYEGTNSQFINGWEPRVLLDFNVDGVIYDKI